MSNLKKVFPAWANMWAGYTKNYWEDFYSRTLGEKVVHMLALNSFYSYWKNDNFADDEESSVDKIMIYIRSGAVKFTQSYSLHKEIYSKLKISPNDYKKVKELTEFHNKPYHRTEKIQPAAKTPSKKITQSHNQYLGFQFDNKVDTTETYTNPASQTTIIAEHQKVDKSWTDKHLPPADQNWIARLLGSFNEARMDLEGFVQGGHIFFATIYSLSGSYVYDEVAKDYRWKSRRDGEELPPEENLPEVFDPDSKDISEQEYNYLKSIGKPVKATYYLDWIHRFTLRLKKELKGLSATSKQKQEQRIKAAEMLFEVYSKPPQQVALNDYDNTMAEAEGFEEFKTVVGNYFVNLLNPPPQPPRPLTIILCGPPGVGKSMIAEILARASKKAFIKLDMGGISEPTFLKGREIAYGGAQPGKILEEIISKADSRGIVLVDEFEKIANKAVTAIIGNLTDPDQNKDFVDDWLKGKVDVSQCVFILTANYPELIEGYLLSRALVINLVPLSYQKRIPYARAILTKLFNSEANLAHYSHQLSDDLMKLFITETFGLRQLKSNINIFHLGVRAWAIRGNLIHDLRNIAEQKESRVSIELTYQGGQKIVLAKEREELKDPTGFVHTVFTDIADWPGNNVEEIRDERNEQTILDLSGRDLRNYDFSSYPSIEVLDISNNDFDNINLSACPNLRILNASNNENFPINAVSLLPNTLEEFFFSDCFEGQELDLKHLVNLSAIAYNRKVKEVSFTSQALLRKVEQGTDFFPTYGTLTQDEQLDLNSIDVKDENDYKVFMRRKLAYWDTTEQDLFTCDEFHGLTLVEFKNWKNIDENFTSKLIKRWKEQGFTPEQTQEWINVGFTIKEHKFCAWLRDSKGMTAEQTRANRKFLEKEWYTGRVDEFEQWLVSNWSRLININEELRNLCSQTRIERLEDLVRFLPPIPPHSSLRFNSSPLVGHLRIFSISRRHPNNFFIITESVKLNPGINFILKYWLKDNDEI